MLGEKPSPEIGKPMKLSVTERDLSHNTYSVDVYVLLYERIRPFIKLSSSHPPCVSN